MAAEQKKYDLEEIHDALGKALDFLGRRLSRVRRNDVVKKVRGEYLLLRNIPLYDTSLDLATHITSGEASQADKIRLAKADEMVVYDVSSLGEKLPRLQEMAQEYPMVRKALRAYLPRLEQFAQRDERLRDLYETYNQAFGGEIK